MKSSFFSIIIPTYNRPDLLKRAVESVLKQTYLDFEIIIVNDGSSVDYNFLLPEIINNKQVLYFTKPNGGLSDARNFGINKAKGDFICFLDDDDEYLENHLETLFKRIEKEKFKTGLYKTLTYIKSGKTVTKQQYKTINIESKAIELIYSYMMACCNVCVASEIFFKNKFDINIPISEDYELWSRIALKYPVFEIICFTTIYNFHGTNMSMLEEETVHLKQLKAFKQIFSIPGLKKELPVKYWAGILSNRYLWLSFAQRKKKKLIKAGISRFKSIYYKLRIKLK